METLPLQGLPYTVFQPLYIYGPHTAKDYMGYFLDRLMRNRPVPIPAPGIQLVSLSHVEDLASMMAKVPTGLQPPLPLLHALGDLEVTRHRASPRCRRSLLHHV